MLLIALAICSLGILQIYSATHATAFRSAWMKQCVWLACGLFLMWILARVDYHNLLSQVPILYGITLAFLALTLVVGSYVWGSKRWIPLFQVTFLPFIPSVMRLLNRT